jgi:hypothetical protein
MVREVTVNRRRSPTSRSHIDQPDPWVPSSELRRVVGEAAADPALLDDVADVRGGEIDDA